jgi:glucan biosynthesis protein
MRVHRKFLLFQDLKNEFLRITVPDASVEDLLRDGSTSIDLMHYATQIDDILQIACQEYSKQLAITFASEKSLFQTSKFSINLQHWHQEQLFVKIRFLNLKSQIKHRLCKFSPCCFYHK